MKSLRISLTSVTVLSLFLLQSHVSHAQSSEASDKDQTIQNPKEIQFSFGVRPWAASWDIPLIDLKTVIPTSGPPPVIKAFSTKVGSSTTILPYLTLGARYHDVVFGADYVPNTSFSDNGLTAGRIKRDEADVSVGYALTPNIVASLGYKYGGFSQLASADAVALIGNPVRYKVQAILLGLSANAPLQGKLSIYGTFAYGPARQTLIGAPASFPNVNGTYVVSELGFAYRLLGKSARLGVDSVTMQLGYRAQTYSERVPLPTFSSTPPFPPISSVKEQLSDTTQGPILGLIGSF